MFNAIPRLEACIARYTRLLCGVYCTIRGIFRVRLRLYMGLDNVTHHECIAWDGERKLICGALISLERRMPGAFPTCLQCIAAKPERWRPWARYNESVND